MISFLIFHVRGITDEIELTTIILNYTLKKTLIFHDFYSFDQRNFLEKNSKKKTSYFIRHMPKCLQLAHSVEKCRLPIIFT